MRIGFGRQTASGAHGSAVIPMVCPEKIPLFASKSESLSARAMVSVSLVSHQLRCPKVSKGERREAGIQWIQPPKAVSDPEFRQTTSGAHGSANRADCLPRGKPFGAPAGAQLLPTGPDAPTAARVMGLAALWGAHTFLSMAKEKCVKESQRHGAVGGGHTQPLQGGMLWRSLCFFARQKASGKSNPRWPCLRAMRPVAERR